MTDEHPRSARLPAHETRWSRVWTGPRLWCAVLSVSALAYVAPLACNSDVPAAESPAIDLTGIVIEDVATQPATTVPLAPRDRANVLQFEVSSCGIFDPAVDFSDSGWIWNLATVHEIHAGLVTVSGARPPTIELALAGRHEISDDRLRHEFELRAGLKFSDGSPILTSDVVWSWERALRKSTPPSEARDIFGRISGVTEFLSGESESVAGLSVIDDRRLAVELTEPDPVLLYRLARPAAYVLSEADANRWGDYYVNDEESPDNVFIHADVPTGLLPVGAGPFRLAEYADPGFTFDSESTVPTGDRCVLLPNPHHWNESVPMLDALVANVVSGLGYDFEAVIPGQTTRFIGNELDLAPGPVGFELEDSGADAPRERVSALSDIFYRFLIFNPELAPMDDLAIRRALVQAAPLEHEFDPEFTITRASGIVPEILVPLGTDPPRPSWLGAEPDPGAAARLRGWELGAPDKWAELDLWLDLTLASWADDLGVEVVPLANQFYGEDGRPVAERELTLFSFGTTSPLPGTALRVALEAFGDEDPPAPFDRLKEALARAELEPDLAVRLERLLAIEAELIDLALVLPIEASEIGSDIVVQPWVQGLNITPFGGSRFAGVWLSPDAPERDVPTGAP